MHAEIVAEERKTWRNPKICQ